MPDMGVGRMRWACKVLDHTQSFAKVLRDIAVRGESIAKDTWGPAMVRQKERDADIDVVLLSINWHKPADASTTNPVTYLRRDLVFSAQKVGEGLDLGIERFWCTLAEEQKRVVMGQSAWRTALDILDMVKQAESQRSAR